MTDFDLTQHLGIDERIRRSIAAKHARRPLVDNQGRQLPDERQSAAYLAHKAESNQSGA